MSFAADDVTISYSVERVRSADGSLRTPQGDEPAERIELTIVGGAWLQSATWDEPGDEGAEIEAVLLATGEPAGFDLEADEIKEVEAQLFAAALHNHQALEDAAHERNYDDPIERDYDDL